jgi:hypothetical protein
MVSHQLVDGSPNQQCVLLVSKNTQMPVACEDAEDSRDDRRARRELCDAVRIQAKCADRVGYGLDDLRVSFPVSAQNTRQLGVQPTSIIGSSPCSSAA